MSKPEGNTAAITAGSDRIDIQSSARQATPKQVLLRFYDAEASYMKAYEENGVASFAEMRKTMSPDVVLHQSPDLPFGGEYVGHEGYERWAVAMATIFDKLEVKEREFFEHGDTVVVVCRFLTRSRKNGSVQDFPMTQVVSVRDGLIVEFRPFYWNVPAYVAAACMPEPATIKVKLTGPAAILSRS